MPRTRSRALVAIVAYKFFTTGILTAAAIVLLTAKNKNVYTALGFVKEYMTVGKREIFQLGLAQILSASPNAIRLYAAVTLVYALVSAIEGIGLWFQKAWATVLVVVVVGATIPIEIYEIIHKTSIVKLVIFAVNLAMFVYLLRHALEERKRRMAEREII